MKRRINGDFYVIEESETHIVLGNRACPFGDKVLGRPSMCMMTSNVFGHVAAENLGYQGRTRANHCGKVIRKAGSSCTWNPDERVEGEREFPLGAMTAIAGPPSVPIRDRRCS